MSHGFVKDFLTWLAAFSAFLIAMGVVLKSPVGTWFAWVWSHLVGQPLTDWFRATIIDVIGPHIKALRDENTVQHADGAARLGATEGRLTAAINDLDARNTADHLVMKAGIASAQAAIIETQRSLLAVAVVAVEERAEITHLIADQKPDQ